MTYDDAVYNTPVVLLAMLGNEQYLVNGGEMMTLLEVENM